MIDKTQAGEHKFIISGPTGDLEARLIIPRREILPVIAVVCHPHSQQGGTMQNKVVTTIARLLRDLGIPSLRFNFRGVGASAGEFDHGIGETEDVIAAVNYLQTLYPDSALWLAGFSFGSFVAYRAAAMLSADKDSAAKIALDKQGPSQLITIAPPIQNYDFQSLPEPEGQWIVIQGDADEVVAVDQVYDWLLNVKAQHALIRMPGVDHFFHGKLIEMQKLLREALSAAWPELLLSRH